MVIPKGDGKLRICGDFKVSVNPLLDIDQYPLLRPEDLFTTLKGGRKFSRLDLQHAYSQIKLKVDSKELATLSTHKELHRCNQLPFGNASVPAIFQKAMDSILQGILYVLLCYLDDILIAGPSVEEHLKSCEEVLRRLQNHGLHLKEGKCVFLEESVEFLGHSIDACGVSTSAKKVEVVQKTPAPRNVQELHSFLGLVHYYGKFIPNLSSLLQPLNQLLLKDQQWRWTAESQRAFELVKGCLTKAPVLAHYNSALPLRLSGDASPYGLGAVISHVCPDSSERPIAYAS